VLLAAPRGFCAGVRRAIAAVEDALALHGAPVFVFRPIVHNLAVVRALEAKGAVFVRDLGQIPYGAVVVFSAHGVSPETARAAALRRLVAFDAVCPLVAKVHRQVLRFHRQGRHVLLIGHEGHPEVVGTLGHLPSGAATLVVTPADIESLPLHRDAPVAYSVQTTFSVDEAASLIGMLAARFSDLAAPAVSDICYATTNRQAAISELARRADAVIVVGETFSSNASRLAELAAQHCPMLQLIPDSSQLDWSALPASGGTVAVTAAASTPETSVAGVVRALASRYRVTASEETMREETVEFGRVRVAPPASG
jgi:4-hydroxy-3-methylbut-2-enyl diphosphate reductase